MASRATGRRAASWARWLPRHSCSWWRLWRLRRRSNAVRCCSSTASRARARTSPRRRCASKATATRTSWVKSSTTTRRGRWPNKGEVEKQIEEAIATLRAAHRQVPGRRGRALRGHVGHVPLPRGKRKGCGTPRERGRLRQPRRSGKQPGRAHARGVGWSLRRRDVRNPNGTWKAPRTSRSRTRRTCRRLRLPETFQQMFRFFRGKLPRHDIVPQKTIQVAGKALEFPQNTGLAGDTVEVWPVNSNGERASSADRHDPDHRRLGGRRRMGAGRGEGRAALRVRARVADQDASRVHGAVRAQRLRDAAARVGPDLDRGRQVPGPDGAVQIRYKEYWGNEPGQDDELLVNGLELCTRGAVPVRKEGERLLRVRLGRQGRKHAQRRTGAEPAAVHPGRAGVPARRHRRRTKSSPTS